MEAPRFDYLCMDLTCPWSENGQMKCGINIYHRIIFSHKRKWNPTIYIIIVRTTGHDVESNKPDTERQRLYAFLYMSKLKFALKNQKQ